MTSASLAVICPNTGAVIGEIPLMTDGGIARELAAAARALPDLRDSMAHRANVLNAAIRALDRAGQALTASIINEGGKLPSEAAAEVAYARSFLVHARTMLGQYPFETEVEPGRFVRERPIGVALLVAPFNDPLAGLARKIGPAIAAGCPCLVKPASLGAMTARTFADALATEGLAGEIRFLFTNDHESIAALLDDPRVGLLSFTGSTTVGRLLAARAAAAGTAVVAELGGNNPFVILADADLDRAVTDLVARKTRAAGQACSSINRVFVERAVYADVKERLAAAAASFLTGPSDAAGSRMGPLRTAAAAQRQTALEKQAIAEGAKQLAKSPCLAAPAFLSPFTVLETDGASVFDRVEAFGPLLSSPLSIPSIPSQARSRVKRMRLPPISIAPIRSLFSRALRRCDLVRWASTQQQSRGRKCRPVAKKEPASGVKAASGAFVHSLRR